MPCGHTLNLSQSHTLIGLYLSLFHIVEVLSLTTGLEVLVVGSSLPKTIVQKTVYVAREARNILRPDLQTAFDAGQASSISGLSEKSPALQGLSRTTISPRIPFHSIIGDQGRGDTPDSSDGVVAYRSSHVDGAQSELIVPADHTAHAHPQALLEIRRILRLHLEEARISAPSSPKSVAKGVN